MNPTAPSAPGPTELAAALAGATTPREARRVIAASLPQPAGPPPDRPSRDAAGRTVDRIGIWRRTHDEQGPVFVRDFAMGDEMFWADVDRIGPKQGRRVVLLGESVARGAFFDPLFTCASALGGFLDAAAGPGQVDVVDLSRNGQQYGSLHQVLTDAAALDPDVYVVFASNNWAMEASTLDADGIAATLEAGGSWHDVRHYFEEAMRAQITRWMNGLRQAAAAQGVPMLVVIPALNMREKVPAEGHDPLLATAERQAVERQLAAAERLLAAGKYGEAKGLAETLVEADAGVNSRAFQICGLSALALGEATAMQWFEAMEDARLYLPAAGQIRSRTFMTREMVRWAAAEGVHVVDLAPILLAANGGVPPGRELFLDLVHMTAPGIRMAMAAVAEQLLSILRVSPVPAERLLQTAINGDAHALAQGHFIAALANGGQELDDVAAHHAREAVRHDPEIATLVPSLIRMMLDRRPHTYYRAYAHIAAATRRFPGLRYVLYKVPVAAPQAGYVSLSRALAAAAESLLPGTVAECERLVRQTTLRTSRPTSLLPFLRDQDRFGSWRRDGRSFVRAYTPTSVFLLQCGEPHDVILSMTARRGAGSRRTATAALQVNGRDVHRWEIGASWTDTSCLIAGNAFCKGVNEISIAWPDPECSRADRVAAVVEAFRAGALDGLGFFAEANPIYGDIFALAATLGPAHDHPVAYSHQLTAAIAEQE
jgi:hypothetical protein